MPPIIGKTIDIKEEFQRLKGIHYLDHVGATLYSEKQVHDVAQDMCNSVLGNPHSLNTVSKQTKDVVDQIRYRVLQHFNTNIDEYDVIFTSGTTAALKLVAESFDFGPGDQGVFMYSQENHTSVLGMRELVAERASSIICRPMKEFERMFSFNHSNRSNVDSNKGCKCNSLIVLPGQCNFSGAKIPLKWVELSQAGILENTISVRSNWAFLLDAASLVSTCPLDLSLCKPDFVTLSFYKIFGYPTGLGALLVKNSSSHLLSKRKYYGGGTVLMAKSSIRQHKVRPILHERFEDGTLPFLSIIAVGHGLDTIHRLTESMDNIMEHTFLLARRAHHSLKALHHFNNRPVAVLYCDNDFEDPDIQGATVNFNLIQSDGKYIGYHKVLVMANSHNILLRTGCFCNPGACQRHLSLSEQDLDSHFEAGHVCGDQNDLVKGVPTGSIRISFGYMSTEKDVDAFLNMIYQCFVDNGSSFKAIEEPQEEWHDAIDDTTHIEIMRNIQKIPNQAKLSEVVLYPVKSCGGFKPKGVWPIGPRGLMYDRTWMIVSAAGTALTQSLEPLLALVRPDIDMENRLLHLKFSGSSNGISVPLDKTDDLEIVSRSLCQSKVCGDRIQGLDCGDEVASWLSSKVGRHGLRLVRQLNQDGRSDKGIKKSIALSNKAQFLMISETSVCWLADQIDPSECETGGLVDRFRANLVIEGLASPFMEHDWHEIKIGTQCFTVDGPCTRCGVVCVDQATGKKTNEPLRTLSKVNQSNIHFGMYLSHQPDADDDGIGLISVGDTVLVIEKKCSKNHE